MMRHGDPSHEPQPAGTPFGTPGPATVPDDRRDPDLVDDTSRDPDFADDPRRDPDLADEVRQDPDFADGPRRDADLLDDPRRDAEFADDAPRDAELVEDPDLAGARRDQDLADDPYRDQPAAGREAEPELLVEPEPVPDPDATPAPVAAAPTTDEGDAGAALFGGDDAARFRARWRELQADFVDDPKQAVQGADDLVGEVMRALTEVVAEHKEALEAGWHDGAGETEDLRVALRRYRSFFDQLLQT